MNNKTEQIWDDVWQTGASGRFITALRLYYNTLLGRLILPHISAEGTSLELGCGTAQLSLMIAPHIKEVTGLDISSEGLAIAEREKNKRNIHNARFVKADVQQVPFDHVFDVVWSAGLIEHFFDKDIEIVRQHLKATKPGGVAIMSVPYAYSLHSLHYGLTRPVFTRRFWPWSQERYFQKFYSVQTLRKLGKAVGKPFKVYFLRPWFLGLLMGIIVLEIKN
ncbi:MAG: class I SAM-dependent methyltransferase [Candidatus Andersenbacteria bacterium]|nr:class I SAM-dependent methyltransferase [Candidatus Andersenbacteria bacterium]